MIALDEAGHIPLRVISSDASSFSHSSFDFETQICGHASELVFGIIAQQWPLNVILRAIKSPHSLQSRYQKELKSDRKNRQLEIKNLWEATKVFTRSLNHLPVEVVTGQGLSTNGGRQGRAKVVAEAANARGQWSLGPRGLMSTTHKPWLTTKK
jgi:hypothetical protein